MESRGRQVWLRGAVGREPTCTEGSDVLIHLEADNRAVVINDVCLSVPGTGNHLLDPVALREARQDCRDGREPF